eukprot:scaffold27986_cov53-Cyclotella_meneghiniana.AAC.2
MNTCQQKKIDEAAVVGRQRAEVFEDEDHEVISEDDEKEDEEEGQGENDAIEKEQITPEKATCGDALKQQADLLSREELINALNTFAAKKHGCKPEEKYDNRIQYGMVGFQNGDL